MVIELDISASGMNDQKILNSVGVERPLPCAAFSRELAGRYTIVLSYGELVFALLFIELLLHILHTVLLFSSSPHHHKPLL